MRCCVDCEFNDGFIYPTMPPKYRCTVTNQYHFGNFDCNLEFAPVVRCKDCKFWNTEGQYCDRLSVLWEEFYTSPNDYCSHGERKEDDEI